MLDEISQEDLAEVAEEVRKRISATISRDRYMEIDPEEGSLCAVDGGSAVLADRGTYLIGAVRIGYFLQKEDKIRMEISKVRIRLFDTSGDHPEDLVSGWRRSMEMEYAMKALDHLSPGDVLVMDGSLDGMVGLISTARKRGVLVAGVSKSSRLNLKGGPAAAVAMRSALEAGIKGAWFLPVYAYQDGVWSALPEEMSMEDLQEVLERSSFVTGIARLHGHSDFAFRVDLTDMKALSVLASLSSDAVYPGYPYPLAAIHNRVAIHRSFASYLKALLRERIPEIGGRFHDVLDMNG